MNVSNPGVIILVVFAFLVGNVSMLAAVWAAIAILKKADPHAD